MDKARRLKQQGNENLKRKEWRAALDCYAEAEALASGAATADVEARKAGHSSEAGGKGAAGEPLPFSRDLELNATRLKAVAAVNASVALAKSGDPAAAASLAREAPILDPIYFDEAMLRLQQALSMLRDTAGAQAAARNVKACAMSAGMGNG